MSEGSGRCYSINNKYQIGAIVIAERLLGLAIRLLCLVALIWVSASFAAPSTPENRAWNVNYNPDGRDPSRYYGEWSGHRYFPSPEDWRSIGVYQFITDRFRDGDPTNNDGKYGGYNLYDLGARHGGDFKGAKEALAYIKSLGYDAVWISPVFQNRYNSYHGYAQIDFTLLDDRFGTLQDFREMVDEAHRLGMYVIVDIVVNHMDNLFYFEGHEHEGAPFRLHDGEYKLLPRNPQETYVDFKVDNTFYREGSYSDIYDDGGILRVDPGGGSFWFSDFHHNGNLDSYGDPWQNHLGKIYGIMDDLRTTHPRVQDKIIAMTKALISSTDIDGIRMDTPMQVPLSFFKRWVPAIKAHARSLGKDNFFTFAEFYCDRPRAGTMVGRGKSNGQLIPGDFTFDGGINYNFYFKYIGPAIKAQQGGVSKIMSEYQADWNAFDFYNPARRRTNYVMLNFFNNHDQWRLNWEHDGFKKTLLSSAIIAFWPGLPLFYYGDEQGFATKGTALDGYSREDFMTSKAWFNQETRSEAHPNPVTFDNFNMTHPHYLYIQKLMNVRKQYFALRETDEVYERFHQLDDTNGIYAFTRVWGEPKNWVLVVFNTWRERLAAGGPEGVLHTGWSEGDQLVNVLRPREKIRIGRDGTLPAVWLDGYEAKVYVREQIHQALNPVVEAITPEHDSVVPAGAKRIRVAFSEPMDRASLERAVYYDSLVVPANQLTFAADHRSLEFEVTVVPGIHKVKILNTARARSGKALFGGDFASRFRSGSELNPLVKVQKDFVDDPTLATYRTTQPGSPAAILLSHKADGAQKFRVSVDQGQHWSRWFNYAPSSEVAIGETGSQATSQPREAWVQYWADGSAAYFVRSALP